MADHSENHVVQRERDPSGPPEPGPHRPAQPARHPDELAARYHRLATLMEARRGEERVRRERVLRPGAAARHLPAGK